MHPTPTRFGSPLLALCCLLAVLLLPRLVVAEEPHAEAPAADVHEGGHAEGGHAEGAHAEGHHAPKHLDNWISLSFGPGKKYENGPFLFAILNFVILIVLLVRFGKKPFVDYLSTRHTTVRDNLAEAAKMRDEARRKLDEIKGKLSNLEREIARIKDHVAKDAQSEKERIIAEAHAEAEQLVKQADKTLQEELKRARHLLEAEAVNAAMQAAEKVIRQQLTDADRRRINEEYFDQIVSSGGSH
jgi:F-type H+-transporting ATPase subunit b